MFTLQQIILSPKKSINLQRHHYRMEINALLAKPCHGTQYQEIMLGSVAAALALIFDVTNYPVNYMEHTG